MMIAIYMIYSAKKRGKMELTKSEIDEQGYTGVSIHSQNIAETSEILNCGYGVYQTSTNSWLIPYHMFFAFKAAAELAENFAQEN